MVHSRVLTDTALNYVSCGSGVCNSEATQEINIIALSSLAVVSTTQSTENQITSAGVPSNSTTIAYRAPPESTSQIVESLAYDNTNRPLRHPNVVEDGLVASNSRCTQDDAYHDLIY